ncbi:hypothetical protein KAFR_0C04040 [Kazachstania africana CBS 2517]|uniref:tRNA-splicing endonuclease subunit Sen15 domain-containing protein n=1 Tax=Kazachstania africana (strain ATCC 22294 / BCRC 22015 / CBS 2517 / CECT 1963 / NBRC 1671 / NRRL Y-8276) TaxID=1071382 RepID=H2ASP5_KAZAF|nr:hypothetical protein KAFR_0C04040 [Kazachstania africana CBS 2517]CCF57395.1 hypothetical protein KAFR_0C04040 [Kazachstania africana CBS 2517]
MSVDRDSIEWLVQTNLLHFQKWKNVEVQDRSLSWKDRKIKLLKGSPPQSSSEDNLDENGTIEEYILPVSLSQYNEQYLTLECLDEVYKQLCDPFTERLLLAIVNDDGTIVFYYIYKGIHGPGKV